MSDPNAPATESKKPVRLVVMGDSDFANDEYVQLARFLQFYQAGAQLLFNAISWTVEDEALAPLRLEERQPPAHQGDVRGHRRRHPVGQHRRPAAGLLPVRCGALAHPPRHPRRPETLSPPRENMNRKTLLAGAVFAGLL